MKLSHKRLAALAVTAALALAACGGDDDDAATTEAPDVTETMPGSETTMPGADTTDAATDETTGNTAGESTTPGSTPMAPEIDYAALSGEIVGGGASSQEAAMEGWDAGFGDVAPDVNVEYDPIGSGGGREQFLTGAFDFAGSDAALDDEEYAASVERCAGEAGAINIPAYVSPIAVFYNLPAIEGSTLNLTPAAVAGIFAGTITAWNDPEIADANPDLELPDTAINPVHRSDKSGTSKNFTAYLDATAADVWTFGAVEEWEAEGPAGIGEGADGTSGVVAAVGAGEGSIGYADASQIGSLPAAAIGVGDGFVEYSAEAAAAVVDQSPRVEGRSELDFAYDVQYDIEGTYPVVLVSYHIACLQYDDQATADNVKGFLSYVVSAEGQEEAAASAGSAPLSEAVSAELQAALAQISAG